MVRGPVRKQSMDPVRSGSPRTGGQSFRVTPFTMLSQRLHVLARGLVASCNLDSGCEDQCFVSSGFFEPQTSWSNTLSSTSMSSRN